MRAMALNLGRSAKGYRCPTPTARNHRQGARNSLLMIHSVPSQMAVSTLDPRACFQAGAPDNAINSKLGPQNAMTMKA
jgi:hypothetical protein